jgi:hypothetical protein
MRSTEQLRAYLDEWSLGTPSRYDQRRAVVTDAFRTFKNWAASMLEDSMMKEVRTRPQGSRTERKELAHWVNHECRSFGLAVACPKTGKPSLMISTALGGRHGIGSFAFEIVGDNNKKTHLCYRSTLPELKLIPDTDARAHPADYAKRQKWQSSEHRQR